MPPLDPNSSHPPAASEAPPSTIPQPFQKPQQSDPNPQRSSDTSHIPATHDEALGASNPSSDPTSKPHADLIDRHKPAPNPDKAAINPANQSPTEKHPTITYPDEHDHELHQHQHPHLLQHQATTNLSIPEHIHEHEHEDQLEQETSHPRPPFTPVFTVITDAHTGEHYHPHVHYVFSDDTGDLITAASLRTLSPRSPIRSPADIDRQRRDAGPEGEADADPETGGTDQSYEENNQDRLANPSSSSLLPPRNPAIDERYIVLDLNASGDGVASAQSLSSAWAVTNATLAPAPTWDDPVGATGTGTGTGTGTVGAVSGSGSGSGSGAGTGATSGVGSGPGDQARGTSSATAANNGLMLKIEGTSGIDEQTLDRGDDELQDLVGVYERRLGELKRLVESSGTLGGREKGQS